METAAPVTIESQLCDAVAKFHHEQQGFAPKNLEAAVVGDMVIVRSEGIFTPNEESLLGSEEGKKLITSARRELRSLTRREVEAEISKIIGCGIVRSFWDMDVRTGHQIEVFILRR